MLVRNENINRKRSNPIKPKKLDKIKKISILSVIAAIVIIIAVYLLIVGINLDDNQDNNNSEENPAVIIMTNKGNMIVELFQDKVPNTVENFINYVKDSFYDGIVFHKVIDDFMIQAGGYYPDGTLKTAKDPIDLEINQELRHVDGAIAMARTSDPDSATSQFYICDGPQPGLDDNYAVFGVVISGIELVRGIASEDTTTRYGLQDWPEEDIIINSIKFFEII